MQSWYQLMGLLGAGLIVWFLYRTVKGRPALFASDKMHQSLRTMGLLGVGLIVFVALLVFFVRSV